MSMEEWSVFLNELQLIDADFTRREATFSFLWSKTLVVDDFLNQDRSLSLCFTEFLEALCRMAWMKSIPTDEEMQAAGVHDIVGFFNRRLHHRDRRAKERLQRATFRGWKLCAIQWTMAAR